MDVQPVQNPQYQTAVPQPSYNAVKIDVNSPQVNVPAPKVDASSAPVYGSIPTASVYEVPEPQA